MTSLALQTSVTRTILRLPTRTIKPSVTWTEAFTSVIVSRLVAETDAESPLLDHAPGVRGAGLESELLDQERGWNPAFGVELARVQGLVGDNVGVIAGGTAAERGGGLGGLESVILSDDRLAEGLLGVPGVDVGRAAIGRPRPAADR